MNKLQIQVYKLHLAVKILGRLENEFSVYCWGVKYENGLAFLSSKKYLNEVPFPKLYFVLFDELANLHNLITQFLMKFRQIAFKTTLFRLFFELRNDSLFSYFTLHEAEKQRELWNSLKLLFNALKLSFN